MVRPSAGLAPELEKLRLQDINPDQNSAASLALSAANGNGASSGPNSASSPESTDGKQLIALQYALLPFVWYIYIFLFFSEFVLQ